MNLAEYNKLDNVGPGGDYITFEATGDTKILRFMYNSTDGSDIGIRKKKFNEETRKYEYDVADGTPTCVLNCIEYDIDGKNPRKVRWERSAYFCRTVLLPAWKNYPRIIDGVWKVSASNPRTRDAAYSLFPIMDADAIKFPFTFEDKPAENSATVAKDATKPAVIAPPQPQKKKYWE